MKNVELIREVANRSGATMDAVKVILTELANVVTDELKMGEKITLPGIAVITTGEVAGRVGRNPQTGEALNIAAYTKVKFKTVKSLKESIK